MKRALKALAYAAAALVVGVIVIFALKVPLNVSFLSGSIQSMASDALNREVTIQGGIRLTPGLWPAAELAGVEIANPPRWGSTEFVSIGKIRGTIGLLALMRRKIRVGELTAENVRLLLKTSEDGKSNWRHPPPVVSGESSGQTEKDAPMQPISFVEIKQFDIRRAQLTHSDTSTGSTVEASIDRLKGTAHEKTPIELHMRGTLQGEPLEI